jgi:hypothetical protein
MPPKRKEHGRDDRAEKAAKLYLFCARDPDQSLKVPAAMMARGYTPEEAADRALQMQESNPARWTDEDEDELERLRTDPVTIGDTAYARFEDQMIQDAELAYEKMTPEQRAAYLSKLMEIDAAGVAYDDGNAPTNKAPV